VDAWQWWWEQVEAMNKCSFSIRTFVLIGKFGWGFVPGCPGAAEIVRVGPRRK